MPTNKEYKITTSWTGFSEITVKAKNEDEAKEKYFEGDYGYYDERLTGNGLDYGFNDEQIIDVKEIK